MVKTPLYELHEALGGELGDYAGWAMPEGYGSPEEEYRALRSAAGMADLSHRGKLRMSGRDYVKFLQGMVTNDVARLEPGEALYAAMLTVKGKMVSDMTVYREPESFLIDLEPGMGEPVREMLLRFRLSYRAEIEDATSELALLSINGLNAGRVVLDTFGDKGASLPPRRFLQARLGEVSALVARVNRTGDAGFDIYVSAGSAPLLWETLRDRGGGHGLRPVGLRAMETARIEAGIPRYGADMTEATIPLEAGLDHAVSYEKGCYVGQEVVARIHWRGHVNWNLVGLRLEGRELPPAGAQLMKDEKKVGYVTSSAYSPGLRLVIALGYIRRELKEPGTKVAISAEGGERTAEVAERPFIQS